MNLPCFVVRAKKSAPPLNWIFLVKNNVWATYIKIYMDPESSEFITVGTHVAGEGS